MEQEQSTFGHKQIVSEPRKIRLIDFLTALRKRGKQEKADEYEQQFMKLYSPAIPKIELLEKPLDVLCATAEILIMMKSFSVEDPTFHSKKTAIHFYYGTYWQEEMEKHGIIP